MGRGSLVKRPGLMSTDGRGNAFLDLYNNDTLWVYMICSLDAKYTFCDKLLVKKV